MSVFSDLYIIKLLLQNIENPDKTTVWQHAESGAYFANFKEGKNFIHIEIGSIQSMTGGRVVIKFMSPGLGEIQIQEPPRALFSRRYETEDDEEFAQNLKSLFALVADQYAQRQIKDRENEEERKQAIYYRLVSGI